MAAAVRSSQYPLRLLPFHPSSSSNKSRRNHPKKVQFRTNAKAFLRKLPRKAGGSPRLRCRTGGVSPARCSNSENGRELVEAADRPPFNLNLAVVLAGFAFEAYTSPPKNVGRREMDAADCETVFLSELFVREVYDGQLFIKLKKGLDLPAMDPWGTSDPYVVINLEGQVAKSKIKWASKEPTWNEDFTLNIKKYPAKVLQVAAWDANLVTPHKRMGNAGMNLESLCDGNLHELMLELEGIGGGGKIQLEVKYKSFDEIDKEKQWWNIPFVSDFLMKSSLGSALRMALGSESVNVRQFVQSAFGQFKSLNYAYFQKDHSSDGDSSDVGGPVKYMNTNAGSKQSIHLESSPSPKKDNNLLEFEFDSAVSGSLVGRKNDESLQSDEYFWKNFAGTINQTVLQKLGFSLPDIVRWDGFDLLNRLSKQSQKIAEEEYVEFGLASPETKDDNDSKSGSSSTSNDNDSKSGSSSTSNDNDSQSDSPSKSNSTESSLKDIRKASWDILSQTETILGALMVLAVTFSQQKKGEASVVENKRKNGACSTETGKVNSFSMSGTGNINSEGSTLNRRKAEEMKALFLTAESAMEAWAMLATSLGRTSFIKSEFEKICFLDNASTDTQVAIWRDSLQRRLVIAFRGTEQVKWKDLRTDLMLVPSGLNPERLGGDFKQEVQVHSGFLSAYDSVRNRIMTLIKVSIGSFADDDLETIPRWHLYVTGHSLGGALATLLALELSSSRMAKCGAIYVTMYNFGSPRVGNKRFAEVYNKKVKDSWRIVNHRDIIPTVPRLMGYCHVAQPVYLTAVNLKDALVNLELLEDGYQGDVIGESTPDVLISEFMKGEKELIEKILQTEISLFHSIRDGTALMQHMEDFYYITLLESVRSNYKTVEGSDSNVPH